MQSRARIGTARTPLCYSALSFVAGRIREAKNVAAFGPRRVPRAERADPLAGARMVSEVRDEARDEAETRGEMQKLAEW